MIFVEKLGKHLEANLEVALEPPAKNKAAILVPFGFNESSRRDEILLTKRTQDVETHKGQISFPGGFWEEKDKNYQQTALRESEEEIGLVPETTLGALPPVFTKGNVKIYPFVGSVKYPLDLRVNPSEVERILYLPVKKLLVEGLRPVKVESHGVQIASIGITLEGELIWGATARILEELRQALVSIGY